MYLFISLCVNQFNDVFIHISFIYECICLFLYFLIHFMRSLLGHIISSGPQDHRAFRPLSLDTLT